MKKMKTWSNRWLGLAMGLLLMLSLLLVPSAKSAIQFPALSEASVFEPIGEKVDGVESFGVFSFPPRSFSLNLRSSSTPQEGNFAHWLRLR